MRTTIEITAEQRARLLQIAARRGAKGFSQLVQEALDAYLKAEADTDEQRRRALMLRGAVGEKEGEKLREATRDIRGSWR
jgi:hypothetical protein